MVKPILLGGLLGGLLLFIWGAFSWMLLPWHTNTLKKFSNEDVVAVTLNAYAPEPGVYYLPNASGAAGTEEKSVVTEEARPAMAEGPIVFATIQARAADMGGQMARGLVTHIMAAMLVCWIVLQAGQVSFARRFGLVLVFSVAASLVGLVPGWIWLGFSTDYTLVGIADMLISWALAGLVIAWATAPRSGA